MTKCPCCNSRKSKPTQHTGIKECAKCGAIYGTCYLGDSYTFVKPYMTIENVPDERTCYFDFDCLGSQGITRRHGWFDTQTKLITQVG